MQPLMGPVGAVGQPLIAAAAMLTVGDLLRMRASHVGDRIAVEDHRRRLSFRQFNARVNRLANALAALGVARGDRVAILSENRSEFLEAAYAAAKLGAVLCCQNWRLSDPELNHCIGLIEPKVGLVSERYAETFARLAHGCDHVVSFGAPYEAMLERAAETEPGVPVHPEDALFVIYTSGTTGLPKGATISHRAEIARMQVNGIDFDLRAGDTFVAWPPLFHMGSLDQSLAVIGMGGRVIAVDGLDVGRLVRAIAEEEQWWFVLMPGMFEPIMDAMRADNIRPRGVRRIGAMADLVPRHQLAEATALFNAPYANTFGSTETGVPPASAGVVPIGEVPDSLAKTVNHLCEYRLVDVEDNDVAEGQPGELALRGPTCFSGYWNAPETNAQDFRGGWFHMGDAFVRLPDARLEFVDRVKYMIKSGGENIYPAEIERILLSDARVEDAVVVRRRDDKWGEVPVAFVARSDDSLQAEDLIDRCTRELARYKRPREIRFVASEDLPRSTTGKIQRHEVEKWLED
mgnify:CR=1 FL=1